MYNDYYYNDNNFDEYDVYLDEDGIPYDSVGGENISEIMRMMNQEKYLHDDFVNFDLIDDYEEVDYAAYQQLKAEADQQYAKQESYLNQLLNQRGMRFWYDDGEYELAYAVKPDYGGQGEGKTDCYCVVYPLEDGDYITNFDGSIAECEMKISFKATNATYVESHITDKRAKGLLGSDWDWILQKALKENDFLFNGCCMINQQEATAALGYELDLANGNETGSFMVEMDAQQKVEAYAGWALEGSHRDAIISIPDGITEVVPESGIATHFLKDNLENYRLGSSEDLQTMMNKIFPITYDFAYELPNIFFKCQKMNYHIKKSGVWGDGGSRLAVKVNWFIDDDNKLDANLNLWDLELDAEHWNYIPLTSTTTPIRKALLDCLAQLGKSSILDLRPFDLAPGLRERTKWSEEVKAGY